MSNDVTIHVKWDDKDGDKFAATQKAKARTAGEGAGREFSGSFSGKLTEGVDKAGVKAGERLRDSRGKFRKAGDDLGRAAGDGIERGVEDGAKKGAKKADDELSKVAKRANAQFSALGFGALSLGLPAAAAVGAAGVVAALAVLPAAVIGAGALLLKQNTTVRQSFGSLSTNVISDAKNMAGVLAGPLAQAGSDLQASWNRIQPLARQAFQGAGKEVSTLTGVVTDFAENAMPGMVAGIRGSHDALLGLRDLSGQVGTGLGQLFENASKGAAGARQGLAIFGGTLQMVEARTGTLLANLANLSSGPLTQLHAIVDMVTGSLLRLTAQGSGAIGFLQGFGGAATGMVSVLTTVLNLVSLLPPQVTQLAGSFTAVSMVASKFGLDVGAGFKGLGDKIKGAGNDLSGVERAAAKAGTAVGGLAAGALNPATLAVAGLSIGLMALGAEQQAAAADAAAHASRERDLAAALRESHGAISENVRVTAAKHLADYQVSDGTRNLIADTQNLAGESGVKLLTAGYLGNVDASKQLVAQLRQTATEHTHAQSVVASLTTQFDHFGTTLDGNTGALDDTGFHAKQLADIIDASGGDFQKAMAQAQAMGIAVQGNVAPMGALDAAMSGLRDTASGSTARLSALVDVMNILEGRNATFEESIKSGNDALRTMEDSLKKGATKADGFGKALINADGSLNTFTKNGSDLQTLATGLETSFSQAGGAIDDMVRKGMPFDQAVTKVNDGLKTQRDRFIGVAEKMGLTKQQAADLATKYGLIPDEITTRVTADTKQGVDAINALPELAAKTQGAVPISADVNKATGKINTTVQYADGSTGVITLDAYKDPATGKVMQAVQYANGAHGFMTIDAFNQAAKDRTIEAKRNADGTVSYIIVDANTQRANSSIDYAARNRTSTINVGVYYNNIGAGPKKVGQTGLAKGGLVGYATGGGIQSVPRFADGGGYSMTDITGGGLLAGPGTGTSDSILGLTSKGPAAVSTGEFVIRASQTRKHLALLQAINNGVDGFAGGGMVQAEDGSMVSSSFYSKTAKSRNPQSYAEATAIKNAGGHLVMSTLADGHQIGTWVMPSGGGASAGAASGARSGGGWSGGRGQGPVATVHIDLSGGDRNFLEWLKSRIRVDGGGDVQIALGS